MAEVMTIGKFIARLRKELNYTQKDLADLLNISDKTVSSWENDKSSPDVYYLPELAKIFNITCDELLSCKKKDDDTKVEVKRIKSETDSLKKKTYITVISMAIVLLVCAITITIFVLSAINTEYNPLKYTIRDGIVYDKNDEGTYSVIDIMDSSESNSANIILENEINGIEVTKIAKGTFENKRIESIILPKNIKVIEISAFENCILESITLNEGLEIIDRYAFKHSYLESIYIPKTVKIINEGAFYECDRLELVTGGEGLEEIGIEAFYNCSRLEQVKLDGLMFVNQNVFANCTQLKNVTLENAIYVESYTFENCTNLNKVVLKKVNTLGQLIFKNSNVKEIYLPNTLNFLWGVSLNCNSLERIYYQGTKEELMDIIDEEEILRYIPNFYEIIVYETIM